MRKILFISLVLFTCLSANVFANVMAFDIKSDTSSGIPKISYRLNENCTSVDIQIYGPLPATTVIDTIAGTTFKGANEVSWDGTGSVSGETYGLKIIATDSVGHTTWDVMTDDNENIFKFFSPRGLAVNKNANSPAFGRIYVAEPVGGATASTRVTAEGIYVINPDGSDPLGQGDTPFNGGVTWGTTSSPYRVNVGQDDNVYISDWSDGHSGLWRADANCSGNFTEILDSTGRDADGLNAVHGSIAVAWIEGTGASTAVYTDDEDFLGGGAANRASSVWKYEIGTGPFPITTPPTVMIDDAALGGKFVNNSGAGLIRDSSGSWYRTQYRYGGTDIGSVIKISSDGKTVEWDSLTSGGISPDPLRGNMGGVAIDEARNRLFAAIAVGAGNSKSGFAVVPLPLPVGGLDTAITVVEWTGAVTRGIDCDLVGNVYVIDNINERLRIYSPPDGPNSYTTESSATLPGGAVLAAKPVWSIYE